MRQILYNDPNAIGSEVSPVIAQGYVATGDGAYEYEPSGQVQTQAADVAITRQAAIASAPAANPTPAPVSVPSIVGTVAAAPAAIAGEITSTVEQEGNTFGNSTASDASTPSTTGDASTNGPSVADETPEERLIDALGSMFPTSQASGTDSLSPELFAPTDAGTPDATATAAPTSNNAMVGYIVMALVVAALGYLWYRHKHPKRKAGAE